MKLGPALLAGVIAAAGMGLAGLAGASAETCTLELKHLKPLTGAPILAGAAAEYVYRSTYPQFFHMQFGAGRPDAQAAEFAGLVTKEPAKYQSEHPFKGVAKLGSGRYAFVLDSQDAESKGYSRLYFDLNHNGDLTDDEVIEAKKPPAALLSSLASSSFTQSEFPRVDVTIDADGTKIDYAFFLSVHSQTSGDFKYAAAQLNAAAYREGQITLNGKPRHVVLLDFNSNGRFDDEFKINEQPSSPDGRIYPEQGDMLLVDLDLGSSGYRSPYDPTTNGYQHYVSKLVNVDGRFYDLEISAAGDKLTLTPSSVPVGYVTNPNEGFRAVVYGEKGFLRVSGDKSKRAPLPEGQWKLLSYTIDQSDRREPPEKKEQEERSLFGRLADALMGGIGSAVSNPRALRYTMVSAQATRAYKAVRVHKGLTAELPFGPPYKPVVKVAYTSGPEQAQLELSIVGSAGEVCSNLMVDGRRPEKPKFTISTPAGEEVATGDFEYG